MLLQKYLKAAFLVPRLRSCSFRSSAIFHNKDETSNGQQQQPDEQQPEFLQLPEPSSDDMPTLKLGETIKFYEIGPVIINTDGTTSRIANWDQMTKMEQEVAWKRIGERNQRRLLKKNKMDEEEK